MSISNRQPAVTIHYSGNKSKHFTDAYRARRFYTQQFKLGNNPVLKGTNTMATATKPTTKKAVKKVATKKTTKASKTTKKVAKKKVAKKKTVNGNHAQGIERGKDLPWNQKKVNIFKALKALKALSPVNAVPATRIAEKANCSTKDVRHYCYHARVSGHTQVVDSEDFKGYGFCLTKKGAGIDLKTVLKK